MLNKELLEILACPKCRSSMTLKGTRLVCVNDTCARMYQVFGNIPNMLVDDAHVPVKCPKCNKRLKINGSGMGCVDEVCGTMVRMTDNLICSEDGLCIVTCPVCDGQATNASEGLKCGSSDCGQGIWYFIMDDTPMVMAKREDVYVECPECRSRLIMEKDRAVCEFEKCGKSFILKDNRPYYEETPDRAALLCPLCEGDMNFQGEKVTCRAEGCGHSWTYVIRNRMPMLI